MNNSKSKAFKRWLQVLAVVYALLFIVVLWAEALTSVIFIKTSLTFGVVFVLLSVLDYIEFWHSDAKKKKDDYFTN